MRTEIMIRRKNKVILEKGVGIKEENSYIATILNNIEVYGYRFSIEVIERLKTYSKDQLENFYLNIIVAIEELLGANVKYKPMYPNFPNQVMKENESVLYLNALIHYITNGEVLPKSKKEKRYPLNLNKKFKILNIGSNEELEGIYINLIKSKTSISSTDKKDIELLMKHFGDKSTSLLPKEIPLKENVAVVTSLYYLKGYLSEVDLREYFKTATDVLRFAVALSNGDVSLAENTKFISFKRSQRRCILGLLENCLNIEEDMLRYKNQWIRLGERLHPAEFKLFIKVNVAFNKLRNNIKIHTFNSLVEASIINKEIDKLMILLQSRPGEFARKLDALLRKFNNNELILEKFKNVANKVSTPVLLQVLEHFKSREMQKEIRAFFPKGNVAKMYGIDYNLPKIDKGILDKVCEICKESLINNYKDKEPLNKVFIDERLKNYLVPFSQRSASKALKTIVRGSKVELPFNAKVIRSFIYWKDCPNSRTDIDLSAIMYDSDWKYLEHVSYTNLVSSKYKACHSGDIVAAPNGASEFIDLDIATVRKFGGRYIVLSMNSYTEQPYVDLPICFVGWMARECPNSGEIYEPKTVENKVDITSDTMICIPMILDLYEMKVIWTDIALKKNAKYVNNLESNQFGIVLMGKAISTLMKPNLYDLFYLHAKARGTICEDIESADTVFSIESGITPYDTDVIMAQYI